MKIVISNAALNWRGSEVDTATLAGGFRKAGHDVIIFCRPNSIVFERMRAEYVCEPVLGRGDFDLLSIARCARALRRHKADIVIPQKDKDVRLAGVAARMSGIPVLIRHITDRPLKNKLHYRFYFKGRHLHHVANSLATRATVLSSAPWLNTDIAVIPNGIQVERYVNADPLDLQLPPGALAIGFVGQFELRKGIDDFAKAWHTVADLLPNAHAIIAGNGPRRSHFEAALDNALRVHWLGFRSDVAPLMKALDILVMPSWFEGFGLVMAEAMAAGCAVVGYNTSSLPELARSGVEAQLVEPRDTDALAAAIVEVGRNHELRARLGAAAQIRAVVEFTEEKMVRRHLDLIEHIVAGTGG